MFGFNQQQQQQPQQQQQQQPSLFGGVATNTAQPFGSTQGAFPAFGAAPNASNTSSLSATGAGTGVGAFGAAPLSNPFGQQQPQTMTGGFGLGAQRPGATSGLLLKMNY